MRAIIIDDNDARALVDALKLEKLEERHPFFPSAEDGPREFTPGERRRTRWIVEDVHRRFHHVVVRWLQDQGASLTR